MQSRREVGDNNFPLNTCCHQYLYFVGANFKIGHQVFENYGQPNHIYFLYHGFSIQGNSHDCVYWILPLSEEERTAGASTPTGQEVLKVLN
jgi:hypothetical protein